ncbi:MAG: hypothetical protein AB1404_00190 [Spirochaetota bacterium]|jgi:hypothetical protein
MILFSILWIPALYLFVEALQQPRDPEKKGMVLAVIGGSCFAVFYFFIPQFVPEGAFGFLRFLYGFFDVVALPVLLPLIFRYLLQIRYGHQKYIEIHQFVLMWLIPVALVKGIQWNINKDPILLVLVPLLWGALSIGLPWLINKAEEEIGFLSFLSYAGTVLLSLIATAAYWAWFSKLYIAAFPLAIVSMFPSLWYLIKKYIEVTKS